ncbi:uncharacterized protein LOC120009629 [Tripterygium wilfordii]|uniref:uncharacterized protein LOC119990587 n=1 Tax=Tripterygium wilfordii TaxID=458696 RepID=UPI0018F81C1A|nr:uncharacterized protein LOC119990587 [Tripterygium wilfordii]XP_038716209.1 uncharacterized protein LOC120009629 [Tripterygium wilfordii]
MNYLREHSLLFLVDPDPENNLLVYPQIIRSFYHTLIELPRSERTRDQLVYQVIIAGVKVQFTTADLCCCLGYPPTDDEPTGSRQPIYASKQEMIDDMCGGKMNKHNNAARRAYLPSKMWLLDDAIRKNLCPIGHEQERRGKFLSVLYYMYKGCWFDIGKIYLAMICKAKYVVENKPKKVGKLFFPRLITRLLLFKSIRPPRPQASLGYQVTMLEKWTWRQSISHLKTTSARQKQTQEAPSTSPPGDSSSGVAVSPQSDHISAAIARLEMGLQTLEDGQHRLEHMMAALMDMIRK